MNLSEIHAIVEAANPDDEIVLCRSPCYGSSWHLVRNYANHRCLGEKDGCHQYEITGWHRSIRCSTYFTPLDRDDRIESVVDRKTIKQRLELPGSPVYLKARICASCLHFIHSNLKEFVMTDKPIDTTKLDTTKLIIVCSDGSTHQAETMASAKQLAKQLVGDKIITATIYVPHTKLERLLPPVKATRINTKF